MTYIRSRTASMATEIATRAQLPVASTLLVKLAHTVLIWNDRFKMRNQLRQMESHRRKDIGISIQQARKEARKPFWMG